MWSKKALLELLRGKAGGPARLYLLAALLFIVSLLGTALFLALRVRGRDSSAAEQGERKQVMELSWHDFRFAEKEEGIQSRIHLLREPTPTWTEDQVRRFWIDPRQILLKRLAAENDREIRELFADVP